jgi:hypothetical protein
MSEQEQGEREQRLAMLYRRLEARRTRLEVNRSYGSPGVRQWERRVPGGQQGPLVGCGVSRLALPLAAGGGTQAKRPEKLP